MIKAKEFKIATVLWIAFILFQLIFSINSSENFLSPIGLLQLFLVSAFLFGYVFCLSLSIKNIYIIILIYQVLLVGVLFQFYLIHYKNPLGFNPMDALFYNDLALTLKDLEYHDVFAYLNTHLSLGDFGYPFVLQNIYRISDTNPIIIAKFFNIFFHLLTCYYLIKISNHLFSNPKLSKVLLVFYGLNPMSVFFITSGLKEPLFALVVVLSFYFAIRAYHSNSILYYLLALTTILSTGLFRSAYPVFIVFSFVMYSLWNSRGKYKKIKQIGLLVLGTTAMFVAYTFVQAELTQKMNYDFDSITESRFGRAPSKLDYIVMLIGGTIGPFPSFGFEKTNQLGLLQTAGNFIKIFFSYFFIVGVYLSLKRKFRLLYVAIVFILINLLVLVSLAASLDYRFLYPFIPLYFLILAYGYNNYIKGTLPFLLKPHIYILVTLGLITMYNFR